MNVIDVSVHNGSIKWDKVKEAGIDGAIIRCGYGRDLTSQDDKRFKENMDGALKNGLRVGVYIYSYARNNDGAISEARHALRLCEPYKDKITLPIYYDLEEAGTESGAKERAVAFGEIIEKAGYWCGVYASESWWRNYLKGLDRFTKWIASWGRNNGQAGNKPSIDGCDMWQFTSRGRVTGISGFIDLDYLYRDEIGGYKGNKPTASKPVEEPKTEADYTLYKIVKGDTLSAISKKYKTTIKAIMALNPQIKNKNLIYAGQMIKIPKK
jgi:lysozyme